MIKKLLLFLFALGITSSKALAQDQLLLDSMTSKNFSGIVRGPNSQLSIVYCIVTEKDKSFLKVKTFDATFHTLASINYPVSKTTIVYTGAFIERGFVFVMGDIATKKRTIIAFDLAGKKLNEKTEDVSADLLTLDRACFVFNAMPQGAVVIVPANAKTGAYKIIKLDEQMAVKWTKDLKADKGEMTLLSAQTMMEKLMVFCKESNGDKHTYYLKMLNIDNADLMLDIPLKDGNDHVFPLFCNFMHGMVLTAGTSFKDGKYDDKKNPELFALAMGPDGNINKKVKVPYEKLVKFLPEARIAELNNGAKIAVVGATLSEQNTVNFVCELFSKKNNDGAAMISISDVFVVKTNEEDEISALNFIPNITVNKAIIKGPAAEMDNQAAIETFYKKKLFHVRFTANIGRNNYIGYNVIDSGTIKPYTIPDDSININHVIEAPPIPTAKLNDKPGGELIFDATPSTSNEFPKWLYLDTYAMEPENRIMVHSLMPPQVIFKMLPRETLK